MAILGVPMLLGPIGGPILGGWLIDAASWHWIFLINVPIGVIAFVYALVALPKDSPRPSESFDFLGVLMMSPGLALFLYGVSTIPAQGKVGTPKVLVPALIGLALVAAFVVYSFRPKHPLLDLRLFRNRNLAVSLGTMFLFAVAFFGGLLLVPTYFQQIRGESVLNAGLLVAPQGIGAMLTMPIAGALTDKFPVGRIVPFGLVFILAGMAGLTQISSTTSFSVLIGLLFIMGLGMGATMMPIMTSALKTLRPVEVARGSTLLNITQQIASSVGVAVMSVILTNGLRDAKLAYPAIAARHDPKIAAQIGGQAGVKEGLAQAANAFAHTYWVAFALVLVTVVVALLLPRKHQEPNPLDDEQAEATPVIVH
jgi:EmrB/QacA subfamily drug resistance transporter